MEDLNNEIDLLHLMHIIIKRWWVLLLFALVAGGVAYYTTDKYIDPMYEAKVTIFVGQDTASVLQELNLTALNLDNRLISDYRELIKTRLVVEEVIELLGIDSTRDGIVANLSVNTLSDSRFMNVAFKDVNAEFAVALANTISDVLAEKAVEIVGAKNVQIVDYAVVPKNPVAPNLLMNTIIAGLIGFMIGMALIFFELMIIDARVKSEEELEALTGVPTLGSIPKFKGEVRA